MANRDYTEKQLKIISGEIPIEAADARTLCWLHKKVLENGNEVLAEKIRIQREVLKEKAKVKNCQRTKMRKALQKRGIYQWRQPKSNEYTEHQKQIVRGEIPLSDVHTTELISICMKARNVGDYELSERMGDLITTRYKEASIREAHNKNLYKKTKVLDSDTDNSLTKLEQALITGINDCFSYSDEDINRLIVKLEKQNDEKNAAMVKLMLFYKQNPSALYVETDHRKAVDLIEELMQMPIRRPETWFTETNRS